MGYLQPLPNPGGVDPLVYYKIEEVFDSRPITWSSTGQKATITYTYTLLSLGNPPTPGDGLSDIDINFAFAHALGQQPLGSVHPVFANLELQNIDPTRVDGVSNQVTMVLTYVSRDNSPETGGTSADDEIWEWDMNAQQSNVVTTAAGQKIYSSLAPVTLETQRTWSTSSGFVSASVVDSGLTEAVNEDVSGNVNGVGIYRKRTGLRVTKIYDFADFTQTERDIVNNLATTLNNAVWAGYDASTVLFLGASIQNNYNTGKVTVIYTFIPANKVPSYTGTTESKRGSKTTHIIESGDVPNPVPANRHILPFDHIWDKYDQKDILSDEADPTKGTEKKGFKYSINLWSPYETADFSALGLSSGPA